MKDLSHAHQQAFGRVHLVGAGPGDPELLTLRAHRLISTAQVLVYDRLVSPEIMALAPAEARRIDVGKLPNWHKVPQEEINALLVQLAQEGCDVVRLKGGDPLIFGRGSEEAAALAQAGVAFDYVPGITAAQGAASALGVPLTHRGLATGVRYVTGHRAQDKALDLNWASLADPQTTLVVYMGVASMPEIAAQLIAAGLSAQTPVLAVASASTPRERRLQGALGALAPLLAGAQAGEPMLFLIGQVAGLYAPAQAREAAYA